MDDSRKTKKDLLDELRQLRSRAKQLEQLQHRHDQMQQLLHDVQRRCTEAESMANFGHWERDFTANTAIWSQGCYEICGVDPASFQPAYENFLNLVHPDDREAVSRAFDVVMTSGKPFDVEYRVLRPDGAERTVHSIAHVHFDDRGRPARLIGTVLDVTARKHAEMELHAARDHLEKRVRQRTAAIQEAKALLEKEVAERKNAQDVLRKSREKYRLVIENTRDIMYSINPDGAVTFISPQVQTLGYSVEEIVGRNIREFVHPDDIDHVLANLAQTLLTGEAPRLECRLLKKDGADLWVEETGRAVLQDDRIVQITGSIRDITERKWAEQALRESEQRYKALFEGAAEGIVVADAQTRRFRYANPAFCQMLGYTQEQLTHMEVSDIHPPQSLERVLAEFDAQVRREKTLVLDIPCLRGDGKIIYADISTAVVTIDDEICSVGFFTDITDRKLAEEERREAEQKYRRIVESLRQEYFFYGHGTDGVFNYVSPSITNVLGYSPQEFLTHYTRYLTDSHINTRAVYHTNLSIRGEKQPPYEVEIYHKDATVHRLDVTETPVFDAAGSVIAVEGIAHDITERRKAQDALRESEEQYRTLTHNIPGMVYTGNPDWSTKVVSNSQAVSGYSEDDFNTKNINWLDLICPDDRKRVIDEASMLGVRRTSIIQEYRIIDKTGKTRWVEDRKTPQFTREGDYKGVHGIVFDITERKRAQQELQRARDELETRVEQRTADLAMAVEDLRKEIDERERIEKALREAEERFRTIFENTVIGLYRTTPDGRILMANPALMKMLDYSSFEELAKRNLEKEGFLAPDQRSKFKRRLEKRGKIVALESVWIKRDGTQLYVCESAVAIRDENGNVICYEGTVEDITERKEAEEKLLDYQERLRSLASELSLAEERLRRRLATDVHDHIGQNLAITKIKLDALKQSVTVPDLAENIEEISRMLGQAIQSTRSLTFELSPPVLYELGFEAAVEWLVRRTREQQKISAEFVTDGRAKPLDHNIRVLLFQAVRELLVNVTKHAKAHNVTVSAKRVADEIQISVEDDGIGFDPAELGSRRYKTGAFGLFSVRERLGHIGGRLDINSAPDSGTKITLVAPINHEHENHREKAK